MKSMVGELLTIKAPVVPVTLALATTPPCMLMLLSVSLLAP
jgi:hypothetical protein